jgi:deoxyribodipyrimidine photo-lyase
VIVTDDFPCFFIPRMLSKVAGRLPVTVECIDSNGILPMRAVDHVFPTAYAFRRFLQKTLPLYLDEKPKTNPLLRKKLSVLKSLPSSILQRWPAVPDELLAADTTALADLAIDHDVGPADFDGGSAVASKVLQSFLSDRLPHYCESRNEPEKQATSGLSPYLHFGHISAHEVFDSIAKRDEWSVDQLADKAAGKRAGWWNISEEAESFLDELITWRELGYNMCWQRDDYDQYESLPEWAKTSLEKHMVDPRDPCYTMEELEQAETYDPLWNAAQNQLVAEGRMHNYMRMLWGKKVLEWSPSPREAIETLIHLNNKYAVDGRNPNSYSGIMWCFGRYDRAWGPERPIFGKIRYMSSDNTARKLKVKGYLGKYGSRETGAQRELF